MPIHPDWQPLYQSFMDQYCDGSTDETSPEGGSCPKAEQVFYAYCAEHDIDYTEPRPKGAEAFQWVGDIAPEEREGRYFVRGRAIHPCKTYHPQQWPEVRVYLEEELEASAESLSGKPLLLDHCMELDPPNRVLKAHWEDGAVEYVAEVSQQFYDLVKAGEIKHVSIEYDWRVLEKLDGVAPRGLELTGLSLLRRLKPGDPEASVEVWEGIVSKLMEMREVSEEGTALELTLQERADRRRRLMEQAEELPVEDRLKYLEDDVGYIYDRLWGLEQLIEQRYEALNQKIDTVIQLVGREASDEGDGGDADGDDGETERERLHREQQERAEKYGIEPKPSGNLTKPQEYEDIPEDQFADPVNWKYPVDAEHVQGALNYFNQPDNREEYSHDEQVKIMEKIVKAALANDKEVSWQPEDPVYRDLPEDLKKRLTGYQAEGGEAADSGLGQDGEPRRGEPKTDEERLVSHYGEEKARQLIDLVGEDAYKLLPERGSGLEDDDTEVEAAEGDGEGAESSDADALQAQLMEAQNRVKVLEDENADLKAKLSLGEAVVEPGALDLQVPPGYVNADRVMAIIPRKVPMQWGGAIGVFRKLRELCRESQSK